MKKDHVVFISYTGEYPNLCSGVLTLEIDDRRVTFGTRDKDVMFDKFWSSGGCFFIDDDGEEGTELGKWKIHSNDLPEQFRKYAREIAQVFNANVGYGCCGGCI